MAVTKKQKENLKKGKQFSKDNPPKNPGRKKSQLKDFKIANEVSLSDIKKIFQGIIYPHTREELSMIAKKKETPALVSGFISAYLQDMKKGRLDALSFLMDRVYGKANQPVEVDAKRLTIINMTKEERIKAVEEIINKRVSESSEINGNSQENQQPK